ncbi:hypothetical protein [Paracoccus sp. NBH48]|uniref:hypothetical protein n=1 Tax=Paracoccus sp. NBH48 TaxID=2596918 RepID=UPI00351C05CF
MDITYLPMRRGARHGLGPVAAHASLSLGAIMDWHTRMVPGVADLEHRAMVRHWSEDHGKGTPTSASRR